MGSMAWGVRCVREPYTSHPSVSTLPPVPQLHQKAPTARKLNAALASSSSASSAVLTTTLIVSGDVITSRIRRIG